MSAPPPVLPASVSTSGFEDGLGRRSLAFDRETGAVLERLTLKPAFLAFERALRERADRLLPFEDERFARVRDIERDREARTLTVVSEFVAGERLSDLLDEAAQRPCDENAAPSVDVALGFLLQALPALSALHGGAGITHGIVSPARTAITPAGQIVLLDAIFGATVERLQFSRRRLWSELGIAVPSSSGPVRLDVAGDIAQAAIVAVAISLRRPLGDYVDGMRRWIDEAVEIAQLRGSARFATALQRFFERALPLPSRRVYATADEASAAVQDLVSAEMGVERCRNALVEFTRTADGPAYSDQLASDTEVSPIHLDSVSTSEPGAVWEPASALHDDVQHDIAAAQDRIEAEPVAEPEPEPVAEPGPQVLTAAAIDPVPAAEVPSEIELESHAPTEAAETETDGGPAWSAEALAALQDRSADQPDVAVVEGSSEIEEPVPARELIPEIKAQPRREPVSVKPAPSIETPPAQEPAWVADPAWPADPTWKDEEPSRAAGPLPVDEPVEDRDEFVAAVFEEPAPSEPAAKAAPAPPPPRRGRRAKQRGSKGHRDKLRSADAVKPVPAPVPPPPAVAPPPVVVAPPVPPAIVQVPAPPRLPIVAAPLPPPPVFTRVPDTLWIPPQTDVPLAPVAAPPVAPAAGPAPLRVKSEPPAGYVPPATTPRARGPEFHDRSERPMFSGTERSSNAWRWKLVAAAAIVIAAGVTAGRGHLLDRLPKAVPEPVVSEPAPIETPAAPTGSIAVETQPAGARVLIDGQPAGETPLKVDTVATGRHIVTIITSTSTLKRSVKVEAGRTASVDVAVYSGWLAVFAPIVLEIAEGGQAIGTTEQGRVMLPPGRHSLTLSNKELGYSVVRKVDIEAGEEMTLRLEPKGALNINAVPWAEVFIDGERAGETPLANFQVPLGTREIVFKNPQFGERRVTTTVTASGAPPISVDFSKQY